MHRLLPWQLKTKYEISSCPLPPIRPLVRQHWSTRTESTNCASCPCEYTPCANILLRQCVLDSRHESSSGRGDHCALDGGADGIFGVVGVFGVVAGKGLGGQVAGFLHGGRVVVAQWGADERTGFWAMEGCEVNAD